MRDVVSDTLRQFRNKMSERRDLKVKESLSLFSWKTFQTQKKKNAKGTTKCIGNVYENNTFLELVENLLERSPSSSEDSDFPLEEMHGENSTGTLQTCSVHVARS